MPTLNELIQDVNTSLDYNPTLEPYKKQVSRAINQHYLEVSARFPWTFLQKQVDFNLYAPVKGADTGATVVRDSSNLRNIVGVGTSFSSYMEGHYLYIGTVKRRIVKVESSTSLYLDSAFAGEADTATSNWTIKFEAYDLPVDLVDISGMMSRTDGRGRIAFVDFRKEEEAFLDDAYGGDAIVAVEKPTEITRSPASTPVATASTGGSLRPNVTYEYMYTIVEFGRESSPSVVVSATTDSTNKTIDITLIDSLDFATGKWSGRSRRIYRRNQGTGSRFYLIAEEAAVSLGASFSDDGSVTPDYETQAFEEDGQRQRIRMWFTPDADMTIELRYQSVPGRLQSDSDQPEWPKPYHHLLVYLALQDAGMQHGMTGFSQLYERRAKDLLENMKSRYLSRSNRDYVRRGFDHNIAGFRNERWGVPSKS